MLNANSKIQLAIELCIIMITAFKKEEKCFLYLLLLMSKVMCPFKVYGIFQHFMSLYVDANQNSLYDMPFHLLKKYE